MQALNALPCDLTTRLQQCLNVWCSRLRHQATRACTANSSKRYRNDHSSVTELLWGLHWLHIKARVQYKILLLVYKALNTGTPPYLAALLT